MASAISDNSDGTEAAGDAVFADPAAGWMMARRDHPTLP